MAAQSRYVEYLDDGGKAATASLIERMDGAMLLARTTVHEALLLQTLESDASGRKRKAALQKHVRDMAKSDLPSDALHPVLWKHVQDQLAS